MATRAKKFFAVSEFSCSSKNYKVGDEVTDPVVIANVLQYGERFISPDTKRTRATQTETEGA